MASKIAESEIRELKAFAGTIARGAGRILRAGFGRTQKVRYKGRIDPVTEYDLKSEKYLTSRIARRFSSHAFMAEEGHSPKAGTGSSPFCWVIDPLDGTVNFAHGFPVYCVSVAVQHEGETVVGAVYDPERDELFTAGLGQKARLNGRVIAVSGEIRLDRALLATGFSYSVATDRKNNLGLFARMVKAAQAVRRPGSAAIDLCWLACGRIDGFWEFNLHPWDTAAAELIVREAGGQVTRLNGANYDVFAKDILASNRRIHGQMQSALTGTRSSAVFPCQGRD